MKTLIIEQDHTRRERVLGIKKNTNINYSKIKPCMNLFQFERCIYGRYYNKIWVKIIDLGFCLSTGCTYAHGIQILTLWSVLQCTVNCMTGMPPRKSNHLVSLIFISSVWGLGSPPPIIILYINFLLK